jgi:N6-adenosine-specific RNA methylase IME4
VPTPKSVCWQHGAPRSGFTPTVRDVIEAPRQRHSRKPAEVYDRIERLFAGPYVELFARWPQPRPGWTFWGDEIDLQRGGKDHCRMICSAMAAAG